jgi:hypothetical protein
MPERPSLHVPNLSQAAKRLQRSLWAWGGLFIAMGFLSLAIIGPRFPLAAAPWLSSGALMIFVNQPILLALAAAQLGLSTLTLIPATASILGPDPIEQLLLAGSIEKIALILVRLILLIMAWNQFLFYRLLYGSKGFSGLPEGFPPIPETIPNRSDRFAIGARTAAVLGLLAVWASTFLEAPRSIRSFNSIVFTLASLGLGFGLGAAFSPTSRRSAALAGAGIGFLAIVTLFFFRNLFPG